MKVYMENRRRDLYLEFNNACVNACSSKMREPRHVR